MNETWRDDCPARGVGLQHAHWSDCEPTRKHPGTNSTHAWTQCCHCEHYISGAPEKAPTRPPMQHHAYRPTIMGMCLQCRLPQSAHPVQVSKVSPDATVLNVAQEPKLAGDGPTGPTWGPGRGDLTPRQRDRLQNWKRYILHIGGDDRADNP